jgi:SAM-dependent methyltransferase
MGGEYPKSFARFYDLIYHQVRDSVDLDFFLRESCSQNGKILEIGVGTGRHFSKALENGADIYGIDISEEMLNILNSKIRREDYYRVSLQDIVDFSFDFKFDLIIAPFRVMMHLTDKEDQLKAINNVYNHLNPGGKFIFDVFVPDPKFLVSGLNESVDFEGEYEPGRKIRRIVSTTPDLIAQIIKVKFTFEWDEDGNIKRDEWTSPLRFFFRYELEHLVERSRFKKYEILGDYKSGKLNRESREFIVVCKKHNWL